MRQPTPFAAQPLEAERRPSGAECVIMLAFVVSTCIVAANMRGPRGAEALQRGDPPAADVLPGIWPAPRGLAGAAQ
jgi:hypothetical protein